MPAPGAPIRTSYLYLEVLFPDVRQQTPSFTITASPEPYYSIEAFAMGRCVHFDRRDLVDRSRVYRFPNTALNLFPVDKCTGKRFIGVGHDRFFISTTDPSLGKGVVREYGY